MGGLVIANIAVNEGLAADHAIIANADAVPDTRSNADMAAGATPDSAAGRHSRTRRRIVSEHIIMVDIGAGIDDHVLSYLGTRIDPCACQYDSPRFYTGAWRNNG